MKVTWGRRARRDLHELIACIAEDSVQTAELVADRIWKAVAQLAIVPRSGRVGRVAGTRELAIPKTPYLLVYRIRSRGLFILRVLRGARKWPARFN
ncbi:MAG TPA: type II toxin-antitoxin system RelE/ParE family toxin [Terracidiphilus sp.]